MIDGTNIKVQLGHHNDLFNEATFRDSGRSNGMGHSPAESTRVWRFNADDV